jgi:hypothetical protein
VDVGGLVLFLVAKVLLHHFALLPLPPFDFAKLIVEAAEFVFAVGHPNAELLDFGVDGLTAGVLVFEILEEFVVSVLVLA